MDFYDKHKKERKPLTDLTVKNAKPSEKNCKLRDYGHNKGLYLFVMASGGKSWRYDYKLKVGVDKYKNGTFVLGRYPEMSLSEARNIHADTRKLVANGIDPNEFRKEQERIKFEKRLLTFEDIVNEWLAKRKAEVKEKTYNDIKSRLEKDVIPEIGDIPIEKINGTAILNMLKAIEERGAYEMASRARQYCSKILRYAIASGRETHDYTADIADALAVHKTEHQPALSPEEIPEFLEALQRNDARLFVQTRLALEMLMLTFVRPIELVSAEWDEFDFKDGLWRIPAHKMKMENDHIVPLSNQTLEIIEELKRMNHNRQHLFTKQTKPSEHMARDTLSKAVRSLGFQGRHTAHGFRALARTAIREKLGYDSEIIERQLAHAPNTSLGRAYDRTKFLDQRIPMMQEWADYVDRVRKTGKVVVLNRKIA